MELRYSIAVSDRKRLVAAISEILNTPMKYKGAPSFAYEVGDYTIGKDGTVTYADGINASELISGLKEKGFKLDTTEAIDTVIPDSLVISYPRDGISDVALENLRRLVSGKATLIKKALGVDSLSIEVTDEAVSFPWFDGCPSPEEVSAYEHFICKLIDLAKTVKHVNISDKEVSNQRYAFRTFLLRLGFIGDEFKPARKILLSRLSESSAFRDKAYISE